MELGLENVRELLRRLGDPQDSFESLHVAGSDGKGSVCACAHSILMKSGHRCGLYTSPHISDFRERMAVGDRRISSGELDRLGEEIRPIVEEMEGRGMRCTFFDAATAAAFAHFRDRGAELAVVEVGLGGRLDSTNAIAPAACAIGNISLEHTGVLGGTIEEIASEKAGIIKPRVPCVTMNPDAPARVIGEAAARAGSPLLRLSPADVSVSGIDRRGADFTYKREELRVSIPGRHQARNAALALEAVRAMLPGSGLDIAGGLAAAEWPCRMELRGDTIFDVTHTAAGAERLAEDVAELYGRVVAVVGALGDKDVEGIARSVARVSDRVFAAGLRSERSAPPGRAADAARGCGAEAREFGTVEEALRSARLHAAGLPVLVTGSFHTAAEALEAMGMEARG
jgi:dihydrofolate synthase/folylpolyglutamate synthase